MVANVDDAASAVKVLDLLMDKQALYALPSMAEEAKSMAAKTATIDGAAFSRGQGLSAEEAVAMFNAANQVSPDARNAQRRISDARLVATQQLIDGIKEKWSRAPEIIVARNMQDRQIPQAVRDYDQTLKSQGATGEPRGFIYKGKVYLLSDELSGPPRLPRCFSMRCWATMDCAVPSGMASSPSCSRSAPCAAVTCWPRPASTAWWPRA